MKRRVITTTILILLLLTGLSVLLYPVVSDYLNSLSQSRVVAQFNEDLVRLSEKDYSAIINAAREYNANLINKPNRFNMSEAEFKEYLSILDFTGRRVIGTLEIEAIKVKLPIYLGTEESILQLGIGHLGGSSLPVGGEGTHSVLSGHRGLPSSTLLTNADKLTIGDVFSLQILNETLVYQINHIVIVEPDNMEYLGIEPDKDYCTLVTCTPYGINSHRLLMRGTRIFPENGEAPATRVLRADARRVNAVVEYVIASIPILMILIIYTLVKNIKSKTTKSTKSKGRKW